MSNSESGSVAARSTDDQDASVDISAAAPSRLRDLSFALLLMAIGGAIFSVPVWELLEQAHRWRHGDREYPLADCLMLYGGLVIAVGFGLAGGFILLKEWYASVSSVPSLNTKSRCVGMLNSWGVHDLRDGQAVPWEWVTDFEFMGVPEVVGDEGPMNGYRKKIELKDHLVIRIGGGAIICFDVSHLDGSRKNQIADFARARCRMPGAASKADPS